MCIVLYVFQTATVHIAIIIYVKIHFVCRHAGIIMSLNSLN